MNRKTIIIGGAGLGVVILVVAIILISKFGGGSKRSVTVNVAEGISFIYRGSEELVATQKMKLESGDIIVVRTGDYVEIKLDSDKFVRISDNSIVKIETDGDVKENFTRIYVIAGTVENEITSPLKGRSLYEVVTPNSVMALRGTDTVTSTLYGANEEENSAAMDKLIEQIKANSSDISLANTPVSISQAVVRGKTELNVLSRMTDDNGNERIYVIMTNAPEGSGMALQASADETIGFEEMSSIVSPISRKKATSSFYGVLTSSISDINDAATKLSQMGEKAGLITTDNMPAFNRDFVFDDTLKGIQVATDATFAEAATKEEIKVEITETAEYDPATEETADTEVKEPETKPEETTPAKEDNKKKEDKKNTGNKTNNNKTNNQNTQHQTQQNTTQNQQNNQSAGGGNTDPGTGGGNTDPGTGGGNTDPGTGGGTPDPGTGGGNTDPGTGGGTPDPGPSGEPTGE